MEPTVIAYGGSAAAAGPRRAAPLADLDFSIGHDALAAGGAVPLTYPMRGGLVSDFDAWSARCCVGGEGRCQGGARPVPAAGLASAQQVPAHAA